ncbi:MAG: hypothetical protein WCE62_00610 [Polyangiales bacterium]
MIAISVALASVAAAGCSREPPELYTPGLGEIMTLQQMRHSKLWFAGQASNWDLAAYELKELREGFDDVVKFHPTHEDAPVPLAQLVPNMMDAPIEELDEVIAAKEPRLFDAAFEELTKACNSCHEATNFGFNVVERPSHNPYSNQVFRPQ